jgi:beta-lactamase class A
MKYRFLTFLIATLSLTACSWRTGLQAETQAMTPPAPEAIPQPASRRPAEKIDVELQNQINEIASKAQGRVGVGAVMLETGDSAWVERDGHFATQSVYKLPIAMAALRMVDNRSVNIDQNISIAPADYVRRGFHSPIRNLYPQGTQLPLGDIVRYSLSESDGTANDVLLDLAGGPEKVQAYLAQLGIKDFVIADSTKSISKDWETQFRNWATPEDSINLLRAIAERREGLGEQTHNLLVGAMTDAETGHRRLRRGLPAGAMLAHKPGTGGVQDGVTSATNDIGILTLPDSRHILIAVYIENSSADAWTRNQVMSDIAKAVCQRWYIGSTTTARSGTGSRSKV